MKTACLSSILTLLFLTSCAEKQVLDDNEIQQSDFIETEDFFEEDFSIDIAGSESVATCACPDDPPFSGIMCGENCNISCEYGKECCCGSCAPHAICECKYGEFQCLATEFCLYPYWCLPKECVSDEVCPDGFICKEIYTIYKTYQECVPKDGIECINNSVCPPKMDCKLAAIVFGEPTYICLFDDKDDDKFDYTNDCDDSNMLINPIAEEKCLDWIDNNCNKLIDEGCPKSKLGEPCKNGAGCESEMCASVNFEHICVEQCSTGEVTCLEGFACGAYATAPYFAFACVPDKDKDGFPEVSKVIKTEYGFFGTDDKDCDDTDPEIYPDAVEKCDSKDNNCNSQTDEGC